MRIEKSIYEEIVTAFTNAPIESGGILGRKNDILCKFFFDGGDSATEYHIRTEVLNPVIAEWAKSGVVFCGIIHSHPNGSGCPSKADKAYAEKILLSSPYLQYVVFPIVTFLNGKMKIFCHRYEGRWSEEKLIEV